MSDWNQENTLTIVIPYFGKWPPWFSFFLRSCYENSQISWLLFSDCGVPKQCPPNVRVVDTSFEGYCSLVSSRLGLKFAPASTRKLCDIKPVLGELHSEHLVGSRFWAFGDIDVIYGDLEGYLLSRCFGERDVTSLHARRLSGHLTVLRNDVEINGAFRRVKNWKAMLECDRHVAFDEKAFSRVFLRYKNSPRWVQSLARKCDPWLTRASFEEAHTTPDAKVQWIDGSHDFPRVWNWSRGRLWNDFDDSTCYPYLHFMHWKKLWSVDDIQGVQHAWDSRLVLTVNSKGMIADVEPLWESGKCQT